jgi:hypothetical protein
MTGVYVVCLEYGKEFAYRWDEMKVIFASPVSDVVAGRAVAST